MNHLPHYPSCRAALAVSALTLILAACGGGGGGSDQVNADTVKAPSGSTANPDSAKVPPDSTASTDYRFVAPVLNAKSVYSKTEKVVGGQTYTRTYEQSVVQVKDDGTYLMDRHALTNETVTIGVATLSMYPATLQMNAMGQETMISVHQPNVPLVNCTATPNNGAPASPLTVAQTWTTDYVWACGSAFPVSHSISGKYVGKETITVAAGTFTAYKFEITDKWIQANGSKATDAGTFWFNAASNDSRMLKSVINSTYEYPLPVLTSPVTSTTELTSYQ